MSLVLLPSLLLAPSASAYPGGGFGPRLPTQLPHVGVTPLLASTGESPVDSSMLAVGLGYLVGAGSLLLYAPIGYRVCRERDASGLTLSTWWLKLASYTCSDVYSYSNAYPLSTYIETLIITAQAATVLAIVAFYQKRVDASFVALAIGYAGATMWALTAAPPQAVALGQAAATLLNTGALLPQLALNYERRSPGEYSPVTAGLACTGCAIRLFTTMELTSGDPLLLAGFAFGLAVNAALLAQIVGYGTMVQGQSLKAVLTADFATPASARAARKPRGGGPPRMSGASAAARRGHGGMDAAAAHASWSSVSDSDESEPMRNARIEPED